MIKVYKILNGEEKVHRDLLPSVSRSIRMRGDKVERGSESKTNKRNFSLTQRVTNVWGSVPPRTEVDSLGRFRRGTNSRRKGVKTGIGSY